jgi:RNA recognition motif-containing protein
MIQLLERIKMGNISVSTEEEVLAKAYVSVGLGPSMIAALLRELDTKVAPSTADTKPSPTKVLIAHNIPRDTTHEDLRNAFENYGPIRDIYIPKNMDKSSPYYGTIKGFALIKFLSLKDAITAYNAEFGRLYMGFKLVSIEYAKEGR